MTGSLDEVTPGERALLDRLLATDFPGSAELRAQAAQARIRRTGPTGVPALLFDVNEEAPRAFIKRRIPVEGEAKDADGGVIHLLLHVVNGRLTELEFYREDGEAIERMPLPAELTVTA